ncbi:MAG: hypothetical protein KDJ99_28105, partial [Candidatus Competibacteraceae bacterium]|nr:hypothetical protein [Candidatus Competibacteraceae bacterium]
SDYGPVQPNNLPPLIINTVPSVPPSGVITLSAGDTQTFRIEAVDPDETPVTYQWFLDERFMSTGEIWHYQPGLEAIGTHTVRVETSDQSGAKAEQVWPVSVSKPSPLVALAVTPSATVLTMTACSSQKFTISNAIAFHDFRWLLNSELQPAQDSQFVFKPKETGTYTLQLQASADTHTATHRWQIDVKPLPITEAEVNRWITRYQQSLQNQDSQALRQLGQLFSDAALTQLQARQRYQVTLENWNAVEQSESVELTFNQVERWYNPQTYSAVVEHTSHTLALRRQGCGAIVAVPN